MHARISLGISPRLFIRDLAVAWGVDSTLAPIGLLAALAAVDHAAAFLLVLPLVGLLRTFARERRSRVDHALELSHVPRHRASARGRLEADDAYTGSHSRDVVSLSIAVAEELGLDSRGRRDTEFVALLHDVGKIRIPNEIINKPGPLTEEERAIVETHTVVGEEMLDRVGGVLGTSAASSARATSASAAAATPTGSSATRSRSSPASSAAATPTARSRPTGPTAPALRRGSARGAPPLLGDAVRPGRRRARSPACAA